MGFGAILSRFAAVIFAVTIPCLACMAFEPQLPVGPTFRVRIESQARIIKGLRMKITGSLEGYTSFADIDENGFATFQNIRPGRYSVTVEPGGLRNGVVLAVDLAGPSDLPNTLEWPSHRPLRTRSLEGRIRWIDGGSKLSLVELASGRLATNLVTNQDGEFSAKGLPSGLYYLNLQPEKQITIAIDPSAPTDHLDVELGTTSCGLWYMDQSQCPNSAAVLQAAELSGQIVDAAGGSIPNASITLLRDGKLVEQLRSDNLGKFAAAGSPSHAGAYQLVVRSAGFTSLQRTLQIRSSPHPASLHIQLGVMGACSSASVSSNR